MGHPSSSAKEGNRYSTPVTKGVNRDLGPYKEAQEVYCKQCGFACNLGRDARGIDEFAGETVGKGISITDHAYGLQGSEAAGYTPYVGSDRTTSSLSNELSNRSFEDWTAGDPDSWTISGSATETTTEGYFDKTDPDLGSTSALLTRSGSSISLSQDAGTAADFNDEYVRFKVKVKCSTKGVIRLRVLVNTTLSYYSGYNRGQEMFEDLSMTVKCPATVSALTVYILADNADGSAYVDSASLLRSGNVTTAAVNSGCPHCGSFNYY